ncbi:MAG: class I SAM-dependent methyltransferase [Nitrospira sp.]|nr:class I SAM-dependent methyltransferase [Nitrospira sp.]
MNIILQNLEGDQWTQPSPFLVEQLERLPRGRALDLAMGLGRNAVYLARHGWTVDGVDRSLKAVKEAKTLAGRLGVRINGFVADLTAYPIRPAYYDLICCFYFLDRRLFPVIPQGLKPGGAVLYQSVTIDQLTLRPDFPREHCLEHNELLAAFKDLRVLYYREAIVNSLGTDAAVASLLAIRQANP